MLVDFKRRGLLSGVHQDRGAVSGDGATVDDATGAARTVGGERSALELEGAGIGALGFKRAGVEDVIDGAVVKQYAARLAAIGRNQPTVFDTQRAGHGFHLNAQGILTGGDDRAGVEDLAADGGRGGAVDIKDQTRGATAIHVDHASVGNVAANGGAVQVNTFATAHETQGRCIRLRRRRADRARVDHTAANGRVADLQSFITAVAHEDIAGLNHVPRDGAGGQVVRAGPVHRVDGHRTERFTLRVQRNVGAVDQRTLDVGIGKAQTRWQGGAGIDHLGQLPGDGDGLVEGLTGPNVFSLAQVELNGQHLCADCANHDGQQGFLERLALHF